MKKSKCIHPGIEPETLLIIHAVRPLHHTDVARSVQNSDILKLKKLLLLKQKTRLLKINELKKKKQVKIASCFTLHAVGGNGSLYLWSTKQHTYIHT